MENYMKGENTTIEINLKDTPFPGLPKDIVWIKIKPSSKIKNVVPYALQAVKDHNQILVSGSGAGVAKVLSCVEILKRSLTNARQTTKVAYEKCEELWVPKIENLDQIKVVRNIPAIYVLLTCQK